MFGRCVQFLFVLFLFFGSVVFPQGNQGNEKTDEKLKADILAAYESGGEQGLLNFVKKHKDKISNKFIVNLAKAGFKEREEEWLKVCKIVAEEKKNEMSIADVLFRTGEYYRVISDFDKSMVFFDEALSIYTKLKAPLGQGNVYLSKGLIYFYTGDISSALEMYEKALPCFEKAKNPQGQGNVYLRRGEIDFTTGDNSKALEMYDKALPFYKKAGTSLSQGNIYWSKGNVYRRIGENTKAIEMYDRALPFFEKAKASISQGNIYQGKGNIYLNTGDNLKALEMYDKALPFYEKAGSSLSQGNICLRKGNVYLRIGDNSKALEMYDKALPFYEKARNPVNQGYVYLLKGNSYLGTGDILGALEMYNKALPLFEKTKEPLGPGNVYLGMGNAYSKTGDNSKAFEMYDKALPFFEKAGELISRGYVYMNKGEICFQIGDNSKALIMYDKALLFFGKVGAIEPESNALHGKAKVLVRLGKRNEALELFEKGVNILEKVRIHTAFSEMKRIFMEKASTQYEETVMFMLENKYHDKAFKYAELMRGRVFLDRMAEGLVRLDKGLAPELKEHRDTLVAKLSLLSKEMDKIAGAKDEKKLQELKEQYRKIEKEFEELLVKIRLNNPLYAAVRYPEPVSVKELQTNVLEKNDLLLRYFISKDNIYVFLVSKQNFNVIPLAVKEEDIHKIAPEYLFSIEEKNARAVKNYGKLLYRKLFKPLEPAIKNGKEIIIIPDGELAKIPFESLVIDDEKSKKTVYLLEKYRLKYIQSASILAILRKHYQRKGTTKRFIGFGDPVYDFENFKQGKTEIGTPSPSTQDAIRGMHRSRYEKEGGIFTRLKSSGEEVNAIAQLFKTHSQNNMVNLREKANEINAKSPGIKEFDYIHFACHAILGDGFQSLVLSQLPRNPEDGFLTLNEIMNCDYNAKLVVLSACQTGKGKMERGEGVTGLTRAVMYAGTPAVVASLWNVDDIATRELMVRFYKYMLEDELDKEDALRKAKLDLIKSKKYSSPFSWSAFVMYGE